MTSYSAPGPTTLQHTPTVSPTVSVTNVDVLDILYDNDIKSDQKALLLKPFGPLFITAKRKKLISVIVCAAAARTPFISEMYVFLLYNTRPVLDYPVLLLLATLFFLPHELLLWSFIPYVY